MTRAQTLRIVALTGVLVAAAWLQGCASSASSQAAVSQCFQHAETRQLIIEWSGASRPRFTLDVTTRDASFTTTQSNWTMAGTDISGAVFYMDPRTGSMAMYLVGSLGLEKFVGTLDGSCATRLSDYLQRLQPPLPVQTTQALQRF